MDAIIDFVRVRTLNFAVAAVLSLAYLVYQYWSAQTKAQLEENEDDSRPKKLQRDRSRSASRSRSRSGSYNYKSNEKSTRRGRKSNRHCSNCSLCNRRDLDS